MLSRPMASVKKTDITPLMTIMEKLKANQNILKQESPFLMMVGNG
jgi:hypothetical protein